MTNFVNAHNGVQKTKLIVKKNKKKKAGSKENKGHGEGNVKGHPEWV